MLLACPSMPTTTAYAMSAPTAMIPSISSTAPAARGIRWEWSQATTGEPTVAMMAATITGIEITWVIASSQTRAAISSIAPTSSQDISPTFRSQSGTLKTPLSWPGSSSRYCVSGCPDSADPPSVRWRRSLPRIIGREPIPPPRHQNRFRRGSAGPTS